MSWLKRMFGSSHREARAAEGAGQWRRAAALWVELGEEERAAEALLHLARRGGDLEERLEAWHDALRWIAPEDEERRDDVEREMALAVLEDSRTRGVASAEEKRRLADAAARLERLERPSDAADAFKLLGRTEDQARCLEAAGEIEQLEALLDKTTARDESVGRLRRLMEDYEMAVRYGARRDAREALHSAMGLAPDDRSVTELLRRLEARVPPHYGVRLLVAGRRVRFVGRLPAVLGRGEVDVPIRGTSVSRRHSEIALEDGTLVIRDLDSSNGTLVSGLPLRGSIALSGASEVGLGDDVSLGVAPLGPFAVEIDVRSGFDRGERIILGTGELALGDAKATLSFDAGWALLSVDKGSEMSLDGQACALPIHLLTGDRVRIDDTEIEVLE